MKLVTSPLNFVRWKGREEGLWNETKRWSQVDERVMRWTRKEERLESIDD